MQQLRLRFFVRSPLAFGWMAKHEIPADVARRWFAPAQTSKAIRRDLRKYLWPVPKKADLRAWAQPQRNFTGAVLVMWAAEDRVMPPEHGRRLAGWFPNGHLAEIADSYTLIPEDQPAMLAAVMRDFLIETANANPCGRPQPGRSGRPRPVCDPGPLTADDQTEHRGAAEDRG